MTGRGRGCRRAAAAVGLLCVVTALGACATLPPAGLVHLGTLPGATGPAQQGVVQFVPVEPNPGWQPTDIVHGFLIASSAFTNDPAVAREYLAPGYRSTWRPGWAATVVDASPLITNGSPVPPHLNGETNSTAVVSLESQSVATLSTAGRFQAGQYLLSTGPKAFSFGLILTSQGWRIDKLPSPTILMLTKPDFLRDYEPRNLYFVAASALANVLVPDPVFIPQQLGAEDAATGLVNGLLWQRRQHRQQPGTPTGWLAGAATTAFPPGTKLLGVVQVTGSQATVDLGGNAAKASQAQWRQMAAQLVWSLTSSSYGTPTAIRSVVIQLNHRNWRPPHGQTLQLFKDYQGWVPAMPSMPVYFQHAVSGAAPDIRVIQPGLPASGAVTLPAGLGRGPFSALAISPGPAAAEVLAGCRGKTVYLTRLVHGSLVQTQTLPANCTSLSWDGRGNLWVTTSNGPFILPPASVGGVRQILPVSAPPALLPPGTLSALRLAPDGVRAAMIVTTRTATRVMVAAISQHAGTDYLAPSTATAIVGSDIRGRPVALSWWDSDHLLVLAQLRGGASQLYEVPLNGGVSAPRVTPAGATSVTVSGTDVVVGSAGRRAAPLGRIWRMSGLNGSWHLVTDGSSPVVPG